MRAVIRSASFQKPMRALAFAAVLLLALMPSASRLLAARADAGARAGWAELCTMAGLKLVRLAPAVPPGQGDPGTAHGHDGDCAYCPLLASLSTPAATPVLLLATLPPAAAPVLRASQHRHPPQTGGLGSRGPPLYS